MHVVWPSETTALQSFAHIYVETVALPNLPLGFTGKLGAVLNASEDSYSSTLEPVLSLLRGTRERSQLCLHTRPQKPTKACSEGKK